MQNLSIDLVSNFASALARALRASDKTQTELANMLGVNPSLVSRWANNKTDLREETLVRLLSQIPAEHHKMLVESYLIDRCPEAYRSLIAFSEQPAATQLLGETPATYTSTPLATLPERTRTAILTLIRLCESNPPLRTALISLARMLTDPHASTAPLGPEEETYHPAADTPASVDQLLAAERARRKASRDAS